MYEKDASHPFMTMKLTCVTMVGWADVPDSDWNDFRSQRAVDLSCLLKALQVIATMQKRFFITGFDPH